MDPVIIFEDNHLIAFNKPAGWLVQGDRTGDATLIDWGKAYLRQKYDKPGAVFLHPVHRIDRPVSGAVLMARTDKALGRLTTLFREQKVAKTYLALCVHAPGQPEGLLRHFLVKDEKRNRSSAHAAPVSGAREAVLRYAYVGALDTGHLLRVYPQTGRPHQIRVQLAAIGCPILGDVKYGAPDPLPDQSIGLHCLQMDLMHPVRKEPICLHAGLPDRAWWKSVEQRSL